MFPTRTACTVACSADQLHFPDNKQDTFAILIIKLAACAAGTAKGGGVLIAGGRVIQMGASSCVLSSAGSITVHFPKQIGVSSGGVESKLNLAKYVAAQTLPTLALLAGSRTGSGSHATGKFRTTPTWRVNLTA
jgi:hypothetical protein